jgi:hypothetical protein
LSHKASFLCVLFNKIVPGTGLALTDGLVS